MTTDMPEQGSFCSMLDPLAAYPIKHCMNDLPQRALAGDPDEALFQSLLKLQIDGKLVDALQQIDEQIAHRPLSPSLYFIRGMLLQVEDRQFDAIVEFNRALSLDPGLPSALLQRGWARARMHDLQGALADTNQVLAAVPGYPPALLNKSLLLIGAGERDGGMSMLDDLIRASDRAGELLLVRALLLIAEGETDKALADLKHVTDMLPDNPQGYLLLAHLLIQRQDPAALANIDKAIELGSPEPDLLLWRAAVKQRGGDVSGAEADFKAYAGKHPLRAAEVLRTARINLKPDTTRVTALSMELNEAMLRGDVAGMERTADALFELNPEDTRLFIYKAMGAFHRLECDQGAAFLEKLAPEMQDSPPALGPRSNCLIDKGRAEEAVTFTTRLMQLAPDDPNVLRTHGAALLTTGRFDDAAQAADAIIALGVATARDENLRIKALNYARRREEAGRHAVEFIRKYGSGDPEILHVIDEMVFSLQRDPTWPLAIELLAVFTPPPDKQDIYDYLLARGQMHQGETSKALATLLHINSTESSPAMADGEFRTLWDNPQFKAAFDPVASRRSSFNTLYSQHRSEPESLAGAIDLIASMNRLGCRSNALTEVQRLLRSAPEYKQWPSHGPHAYALAANLQIDGGNVGDAAKTYDEGLAAVMPLLTAGLLLNYARLMVGTGEHAKAIILTDLALHRGITPFGKVIAYSIKAFAFDGLGDAEGRNDALNYLESHWGDNPGAAMDALGLLQSYEGLVRMIGETVKDPERGRNLLRRLNLPTGVPTPTAFDKRVAAFRERLRSDPEVLKAIDQVGRIKPPSYQSTCLLSEKELAEHPLLFPLEGKSASIAPSPESRPASKSP